MLGIILGLLKWAPAVFDAGREITAAISGESIPKETSPEDLAGKITALTPDKQAEVMKALIDKRNELERLDTQRFEAMNGDAEKLRASARPEIALRAMGVITIFSKLIALVFFVTVVQWGVTFGYAVFGSTVPMVPSFWKLLAEAEPVTTMIWAPLVASFAACVQIIVKYFGCRERDKAREDEMHYGAPLQSTGATIAAAGSGIAGIVRAFKGDR